MATNKKEQELLNRLSRMEYDARNNVIMNSTVSDTVAKILNSVEDDDIKLTLNKITINKKYDNNNITEQQSVRNKGQVWGDELRVDISLINKATNKEVDRVKNIKIANIPKITDRATYLIGGNEYQFTNQSRLKPGVYTKEQANGEISSFFNVDKRVDFDRGFNNNFKINFNPEKKTFVMKYGTKNVPLLNTLKAVGVTQKELISKWGEQVYDANVKAYGKHEERDQNKLYTAIFNREAPKENTMDQTRSEIKDRLFATELDPITTAITLGKAYKNVSKGAMLDASKKIIDIHRGTVKGDDRESLIFKSFYGAEDHIREKLVKNSKKIINNLKYKLKKTNEINKSLSSQTFDPFIRGVITSSQLSNPPNQTNVMSIVGEGSKITIMGEGGIGSTNAITNDVRQISNSELGFIDPLHTPEGSNIGVAAHTAVDTIKVGHDIYSKFLMPSGEKTMLRPLDVWDKNVAFPGQFNMVKGKPVAKTSTIKVVSRGELKEVSPSKVDAIVESSVGMFDTSANSIPFLDSIQGNRGLTASKMQEQALSLVDRDQPLFNIIDDKGNSIGEAIASSMANPRSPVSGIVKSIFENNMVITDKKGKDYDIGLYNNFSLNSESYLHNEVLVKKGDTVKSGQLLADNNFTRGGQIALGANLNVAYMAFMGYNFEDSAIMSDRAAKKLTSNHMYDFKAKRSSKGVFNKNKFQAYYPEDMNVTRMRKLDKDGVIKVGQTVDRDDVLIAHLEPTVPTADDLAIGRLDKQLRRDMGNNSVKWNKDHKGVVTGVEKHGNSVIVNVKTQEPLKVADKVAGLHGNKHIISKIIPYKEMPFNPITGEYIDMTMNPIGVANRINNSQNHENLAGKIAAKTGRQYRIQNFSDHDNARKLMADAKAAGISDKDILINPLTKKPFLNPIANGKSHILKLEHVVDHKFSARYKDGYDANEQPVTGGKTGGKNLGRMEMAALLARGAKHNLREMFSIKGQRNDEYWRAMELGHSLPPPKDAFVWDKMLGMMAGAGINVYQKGKSFKLKPMTDTEILERSRGELKKPTLTYRKKDLAPMKEGLFDPIKAGGIMGEHYTHFKIPEKILNPITASAAANLVGMSLKGLEDIITGKNFINPNNNMVVKPGTKGALSGGAAVESMLGKIDINFQLTQAERNVKRTKNPSEMNKLHRKIRYLKSFKENGGKPTDYMISNVLVTPSKFRPMFSMGTEKTIIMSDINDLYQQMAQSGDAFSSYKTELERTIQDRDVQNVLLAEARGALYNDMKAVTGMAEPTAYLHKIKDKKGFIMQIDGGKKKQTKEGFFQDKVLERRQDLVGRSTIILNPELGGDQIGIPKDMATQIFQPFIMQKMVGWGYKPLEAQKQIKDDTSVFQRARQVVTDERLVLANRNPTLHRWNMTAFNPILTSGKSIEVPGVVVTKNFGGDFDGDTFQIHTPISKEALKEAEAMKPSASMLKTGYDTVLNTPAMDMIVGAWLASKGKGGRDTGLSYSNIDNARKDFNNHKITYGDSVTVSGIKAPLGLHEINTVVPDDSQKFRIELNQKNVDNWIKEVTKKHNGKIALGLADKIGQVGNRYVTDFGFTLGTSDTLTDNELKAPLLRAAKKASSSGKDEDIIKAYAAAKTEGEKLLKKKHGERTMLGIGISSGGSKGITNTAAITLMPGIVMDANDKPIAMPITKSYSEGLSTFEYWAAAHGARGGNIKKSVSSFKPGWLTKDLMNSIYDTVIYSDTPLDTEGLEYNIDDKKNIMNRYLARDIKDSGGTIVAKRNELITSDVINKMNQRNIKNMFIQSPITDPSAGDGFSSFSYGTDYEGKRHNIGDNIGIISAHTMTEPSLNLAMKSFHTGGAFEGNGKKSKGTIFDRLDRTLRFTKTLPDKATLSSMNGIIKSINKSPIGGFDVVMGSMGRNDETLYVDPGLDLKIKLGQILKMGDRISSGTKSPHDILKYKGMRETQKFLVNEIDDIFSNKLDRRDIETIVRGITNTTRVMDPGSSNVYTFGDVAQLSSIQHYNKNNKREEEIEATIGDHFAQNYGKFRMHEKITDFKVKELDKQGIKRISVFKDRIKHEPFLTPAGIAAKAQATEDWIARLSHNRVKKVLEESTTQGWITSPGKAHPIPAYVTGEYTW